MSRTNESLSYIALSALTLVAMFGLVWLNAVNGNVVWVVVFSTLAALNAAFAGANYVVWLVGRELEQ